MVSKGGVEREGSGNAAPSMLYGRMARRMELLEAAIEVIRREGPTASMDEIAAQAGITKPIVYRYFGDRAGVYQAVAEQYCADLTSRFQSAVATSRDLHANVVKVLADVLRQRLEAADRDTAPAGPWGHAIAGMVQAASTWWLVSPEVPRPALRDHLSTLLWDGLDRTTA